MSFKRDRRGRTFGYDNVKVDGHVERDDLLAAIGAADAMKQIAVDRPTVERRVLEQVTKWQALLSANVADGRQALREVLDGPIRFAPDGKQYRFSGRDLTRQFIAGVVGLENSTLSGVPNGIRTRVLALKGPCPGPLDDGDTRRANSSPQF
jgi:hypothetical protein